MVGKVKCNEMRWYKSGGLFGGSRTNEEENKIPEFREALQKARLVAETHYSDVGAEASLCPTWLILYLL